MGGAKAWQMEQWERGFYWVADKYVCDQCVDDYALREHILTNATETSCDYCGREAAEPIACELDTFMAAIAEGIAVEWRDAEQFMPYDGDCDILRPTAGIARPPCSPTYADFLAHGQEGSTYAT